MNKNLSGMKMPVKKEIGFFSRPKTGRTWIRYMIYRLNAIMGNMPGIIFAHKPQGTWMWKTRKGIIYLVRDPRDVVVSYYFEKGGHGERIGSHEINKWCRKNIGPILRDYKGWRRVEQEKIGTEGYPNHFKVIKYEDFHRDCEGSLKDLVRWAYEVMPDREIEEREFENNIKDAVEWASFDNMKSREYEGGWYLLDGRKRSNQESYKCRRGIVGGYTDYLTQETIDWCNSEMTTGEDASDFSFQYVGKECRWEPVLDKMKDFDYPGEKIKEKSVTTEETMSRRWKECLLNCTKEDVVVWIGAWPSEQKTYKYPNLKTGNCYYIDPLYEESKISEDGVNLFSMVISDVNGKEDVYVSKATQNTSLYREHADKIASVKTVKARTMDNFYGKCHFERVKFVHCNAEGAEYKILNSTMKWLDKTDNIWMEFHKFLEEDWKTRKSEFMKLLQGKGFSIRTWDAGTYEVMTATRDEK